jgi:hypothetical protein
MPLAPAPIFPGTSPLSPPGQRPPDRRALRLGVLISLPLLLVSLGLGQLASTRLLFFGPGLQAQAGGRDPGISQAPFQGFVFWWTRRLATASPGGGYTSQAATQNLKLQADVFHMNSVIIPVVVDMPVRSDGVISTNPTDAANKDTLPDGDYIAAIKAAQKAGLVPMLEIVVRQQDPITKNTADESSELVGKAWYNAPAKQSYSLGTGYASVVVKERAWFDAYTTLAVHVAGIARDNHVPYLIIGDRLASVTFDTPHTTKAGDPQGIDTGVGGEPFISTCTGRRDCEWRHVINAIRSLSYNNYAKHAAQSGGQYTGKLIYAASWTSPGSDSEFASITWWDAVDYIGVDAYFPLSSGDADMSLADLANAWHGQGDNAGLTGDIYKDLGAVSDKYKRPVLFTGAGYESLPASNATPGNTPDNDPDTTEQQNDMAALLMTFNEAPWWLGCFWSAEEPLTPHSAQANWDKSTAWAGDTLQSSKPAGQWLAHYYHPNPLQ